MAEAFKKKIFDQKNASLLTNLQLSIRCCQFPTELEIISGQICQVIIVHYLLFMTVEIINNHNVAYNTRNLLCFKTICRIMKWSWYLTPMYDILHCTGDYHISCDWSFCHLLNHPGISRLLTLYKQYCSWIPHLKNKLHS